MQVRKLVWSTTEDPRNSPRGGPNVQMTQTVRAAISTRLVAMSIAGAGAYTSVHGLK